MRRYLKGDKVEVLNIKGTLEDSWHPALIVDGYEDVYIVLYDGHVNGVEKELVLAKYIRPRPPVVKFSNWNRGDLVHVFDNFAWKLATVLDVSKKKQFLVRVVGSMLDLKVGTGWIRVRHYWQGDQWIVVGKGSSNLDAKQPCGHNNRISHSQAQLSTGVHGARGNTCPKSSKVIKRSAATIIQTEGRLAKVIRTVERTSPSNLNQTEGCCVGVGNSGMRLRFIERKALIPSPTATANLKIPQYEDHQDSELSSSGSCSINSSTSSHHYSKKCDKHHYGQDASDAESCTRPSKISKNKSNAGVHSSSAQQHCGLILRIRLQDTTV